MGEQPELDLPTPPIAAPRTRKMKRPIGFGGYSRGQLVVGCLLLGATVWGMWVTHTLIAPKQEEIVSARLSALVGDYVEAQRFSGSSPERVRAEMVAFMSTLDKELQRRSARGEVVLVGEAVLTKNVPDITESLKQAVFAAGVPSPKRLSVDELQRLQELSAAPPGLTTGRDTARASDRLLATPTMPSNVPPMSIAPVPPLPEMPSAAGSGASVSTFGTPDRTDGR